MRLSKRIVADVSVMAVALVLTSPAIAFAAETTSTVATSGNQWAFFGRALAASLAIGLAAIGAGVAQANIGAASAGTIAERPEAFTSVIVLTALPEIIVLLGFVMAFLINTSPL